MDKNTGYDTGLAKVAVHCSADTFVVNQTLVLLINICGGLTVLYYEIATFLNPQNMIRHFNGRPNNGQIQRNI
jgi:hypothetical protein